MSRMVEQVQTKRQTGWMGNGLTAVKVRAAKGWLGVRERLNRLVREEEGQGTTEYAVLVGVLVVIAIAAVVLFRDRLQALWDAIADSINSL